MAMFLKRGTIFFVIVIIASAGVLGLKIFAQQFSLKEIMISGNYHLAREDILGEMKVSKGESLISLQFEDVEESLKQNPWIKKVAMRKQYPGTLILRIEEVVPKALLRIKKRLYLLDAEGSVIERIEGETIPFLPVINNISRKNRKGISEALKLVDALSGKKGIIDRESVEIGLESYGLTVNMDGEFIKVGYGRYAEKFERWMELEPEIRKRGVPIKYVDLRFKDSVIIKPLQKSKGEKTS